MTESKNLSQMEKMEKGQLLVFLSFALTLNKMFLIRLHFVCRLSFISIVRFS